MKTRIFILLVALSTVGCAHFAQPQFATLDNLSRVAIENVEFQHTSLRDVFAFVNEQAATLAEPPYGPAFALDPALGEVDITLYAEGINLAKLVDIIRRSGNYDLRPCGNWIIVTPKTSK